MIAQTHWLIILDDRMMVARRRAFASYELEIHSDSDACAAAIQSLKGEVRVLLDLASEVQSCSSLQGMQTDPDAWTCTLSNAQYTQTITLAESGIRNWIKTLRQEKHPPSTAHTLSSVLATAMAPHCPAPSLLLFHTGLHWRAVICEQGQIFLVDCATIDMERMQDWLGQLQARSRQLSLPHWSQLLLFGGSEQQLQDWHDIANALRIGLTRVSLPRMSAPSIPPDFCSLLSVLPLANTKTSNLLLPQADTWRAIVDRIPMRLCGIALIASISIGGFSFRFAERLNAASNTMSRALQSKAISARVASDISPDVLRKSMANDPHVAADLLALSQRLAQAEQVAIHEVEWRSENERSTVVLTTQTEPADLETWVQSLSQIPDLHVSKPVNAGTYQRLTVELATGAPE